MKKILFLSVLVIFCLESGFAQTVEKEDGSYVSVDGASYDFIFSWDKKKNKKSNKTIHWEALGFAFSGLDGLNSFEGVELKKSMSYSVRLGLGGMYHTFGEHWGMGLGLGFDWTRYHFIGNVSLRDINGIADFEFDPEGRQYKDSKALIYYLTLPLTLEYQTEKFYVNGSVEGLLKLYSKSKIEVRTADGIRKENLGGFNFFPLTARFVLRTGFSKFGVFGYYQPFPLFQKGKGPELYPFGVGISLNF
ncbi:MAG: hypothetical protein LBE91_08830 [Tannerella sp.]|jgi:hypothetical protein|nr:hypothetical protein [Tannerella sp.]